MRRALIEYRVGVPVTGEDHADRERQHGERGDRSLGTVKAGKNAYSAPAGQVSNEVGIRTNYLTGEDLFVIAEQIDADGTVFFRVFTKPLVNLIWLAGLVFLLGSLVTLWPDPREERVEQEDVRGGGPGRGLDVEPPRAARGLRVDDDRQARLRHRVEARRLDHALRRPAGPVEDEDHGDRQLMFDDLFQDCKGVHFGMVVFDHQHIEGKRFSSSV